MDNGRAINGIFRILPSGTESKHLPSESGSKNAVHRHFQRAVIKGAFERVLRAIGRAHRNACRRCLSSC